MKRIDVNKPIMMAIMAGMMVSTIAVSAAMAEDMVEGMTTPAMEAPATASDAQASATEASSAASESGSVHTTDSNVANDMARDAVKDAATVTSDTAAETTEKAMDSADSTMNNVATDGAMAAGVSDSKKKSWEMDASVEESMQTYLQGVGSRADKGLAESAEQSESKVIFSSVTTEKGMIPVIVRPATNPDALPDADMGASVTSPAMNNPSVSPMTQQEPAVGSGMNNSEMNMGTMPR